MPNNLTPPMFLERRSYRQRRMMDAVRLLPFVGLLLWLLPTLWAVSPAEGAEPVKMSQAIIFVFGVLVCLILAAGGLWRLLVDAAQMDESDGTDVTSKADID
jgi:hypothetical protein